VAIGTLDLLPKSNRIGDGTARVVGGAASFEPLESGSRQSGFTAEELTMLGKSGCTLSLFMVATVNRLQNRYHLWIS
jgi:hypothetical protein